MIIGGIKMNIYHLKRIRKRLRKDVISMCFPMRLFNELIVIRLREINKSLTVHNYWIHFDWVYLRYTLMTDPKYVALIRKKKLKKVFNEKQKC